MKLFCLHKWIEAERFFKDRLRGDIESRGAKIEELLTPTTTILYKCFKCGKPKTVEIKGKAL